MASEEKRAFYMEWRFGRPRIAEFTYEKESPVFFMGTKKVRDLTKEWAYIGKRLERALVVTSETEAWTRALGNAERAVEAAEYSLAEAKKLANEIRQKLEPARD